MNKKAQAASEFSLASTFSVIAIFVIIAGLWSFGIFSFVNAIPSKCVLPAGIACIDQKIAKDSAVFVLMNNLGTAVTVDRIRMQGCTPSSPGDIKNSEMQKFELNCSLNSGGLKTSFYIDFRKKATNMSQTWEGELLGAVP